MAPGLGSNQWFVDQVDATIIKNLQPNIIHPSVTNKVPVPKGNVIQYNEIKGDGLTTYKVEDGTEGQNVVLEFNRKIVTLGERQAVPRIWDNDVQDGQWDKVQQTLEEVGLAMARGINTDFIDTLVDNVPVANQTAADDTWGSDAADPLKNLGDAQALIKGNNGQGNAILCNPTDYNNLRLDPNFMVATGRGDRTVTEGAIDKVYGADIFESTAITQGTALMLNKSMAVNYYERSPFTTELRKPSRLRATDIIAYSRYGFAVVRPNLTAWISGI